MEKQNAQEWADRLAQFLKNHYWNFKYDRFTEDANELVDSYYKWRQENFDQAGE